MQVVATAGHVDHGKSTLVRALTGHDPDRLAEEQRRGMSIELGYCWTALDGAGDVAFVDVPGHERFVSTMLAGVGPVPAVLFVVAADDPWMPQAAEHLAALDAFGVRHGVVAVTRSDLADPEPAAAEASRRIASTTLAGAPVVAVSARDGAGLDALREALVRMAAALPASDPDAPVRLWVDRCFSVVGAGTVVTGTLPAGTIRVGDELALPDRVVRVRGIETLGREVSAVSGVARVALRLGGGVSPTLGRGTPLVDPTGWQSGASVDVRVPRSKLLPERPLLHIGALSLGARSRRLGDDVYRLRLDRPVPLHVGDRAVLRDPGSRELWGAVVLDPDPPPLDRRGDAQRRTASLAATSGVPDLADELRRRRAVRRSQLVRLGVSPSDAGALGAVQVGDWLFDASAVSVLRDELRRLVDEHRSDRPLEPGVPLAVAARRLGVPGELVVTLVGEPLALAAGRVVDRRAALPAAVLDAVRRLADELRANPFAAPDADRLVALGLDSRAVAAAARAGLVLRLGDAVVLLPDADREAGARLATLPQPFTTSQARVALGSSRRVVLPLLELLDRRGVTRRLPDDRREVVRHD